MDCAISLPPSFQRHRHRRWKGDARYRPDGPIAVGTFRDPPGPSVTSGGTAAGGVERVRAAVRAGGEAVRSRADGTFGPDGRRATSEGRRSPGSGRRPRGPAPAAWARGRRPERRPGRGRTRRRGTGTPEVG